LAPPVTRDQLDERRRELLHIWSPHRLANQTNHPKKYMQMVKKGETMAKEIDKAYKVLKEWLAESRET
jgi:hypothetical protein